MARRMEAGCINTGLSQLQIIFNELRVKGELSKTVGNGLRRVLHPYINTQTFLSVLFALSPSATNQKATESTLKFAVTAGMVKVKPIQKKGVLDFDSIVKELREHIARQEKEISANNDLIEEYQNKIERAKIVSEQMQIVKKRDTQLKEMGQDLASADLLLPRGSALISISQGSNGSDKYELDDEKIDEMAKERSKEKHKRIESSVPADLKVQLMVIDEEEKRIEEEYVPVKKRFEKPISPLPDGNGNSNSNSSSSSFPNTGSKGGSKQPPKGWGKKTGGGQSGQSAFDELRMKLANRKGNADVKELDAVRAKSVCNVQNVICIFVFCIDCSKKKPTKH